MYYTAEEAGYLQDLYSDYADLLEETTAILEISTNPMIRNLANDVMEDLQEDIEELNLAFAVGGLVPQGSNEPDMTDSPMMVQNSLSVTEEVSKVIEKWRKIVDKALLT